MKVSREQVALLEFVQYLIQEALAHEHLQTIELLNDVLESAHRQMLPCDLEEYATQLRTLDIQYDGHPVVTPQYLEQLTKNILLK